MSKMKTVIVEEDENYISSLEFLLATHEEQGINLELITSAEYFRAFMGVSQKIDCLIIDENMMTDQVFRQQIGCIFILSEDREKSGKAQDRSKNIEYIDKYSGVQEIFHKIIGKLGLPTDDRTLGTSNEKKGTEVIVVNSQLGGVGKTTVAFAISIQLSKLNRSVLYISTDFLQRNQYLAGISEVMGGNVERAIRLRDGSFIRELDRMVKHISFNYLLPWSGSRASIDLKEDDYIFMLEEIRKTERYDYIVIDTETGLDEFSLALMAKADHILEVTDQSPFAKKVNDSFKKELRASEREKIAYICNRYDSRKDSAITEEVAEYIPERPLEQAEYMSAVEEAGFMKTTAMTMV